MYRYFIGIFVCAAVVVAILFSQKQSPPSEGTAWHVSSDTARPKSKDEYDVIVVGGGFGGLSAGALLAKNGYKVLLVDKNKEVGGLCSSYKKDGFQFCYGAEDIGGLWERGPVRYLLDQLSLQQSKFFVPNTRRLIIEDSFVDVGLSQNAMEEALLKKFPAEEKGIRDFFGKAKKVYYETFDEEMILEWGVVVPPELVSIAMPKIWNETYAATHPNLLAWSHKTYQEVLDEYFQDIALKRVLSGLLGYFGTAPAWTSAASAIHATFGYFLYGGYHALHTPEYFAQELATYIKQHRGEVLKDTYVDAIQVDSYGVKGISVGEKKYQAPIVISNVNAKSTYLDLIERQFLSPDFCSYIESLSLGGSAFSIHLAVPSLLAQYPALIQDKDNQTYITITSKNDPSLALEDQSAVVARTSARFSDFFGLSKDEESEMIRKRVNALMGRCKRLIPELEDSIVLNVLTPMSFEQIANIPQGSLSWLNGGTKDKKPYFKSTIKGLYLSSASAEGPGVESVVRNGALCAQDIMGWEAS